MFWSRPRRVRARGHEHDRASARYTLGRYLAVRTRRLFLVGLPRGDAGFASAEEDGSRRWYTLSSLVDLCV